MRPAAKAPRLSVDDAVDLRDVGGLPCRGGGSTRHLVLLRCGSLRLINADDADVLLSVCGVGVVVDLRSAREVAADEPSVLARAGVATLHLPMVRDDQPAPAEAARARDPAAALQRVYQGYLHERGHHIVTLARLVAGTGAATLVHCATGRDRTGVVVAMLLDAVGVERSAVIADHTAADGSARPAVLAELLERLDDEHGGAAGWLRDRGLAEGELAALRHRLVRRGARADAAGQGPHRVLPPSSLR